MAYSAPSPLTLLLIEVGAGAYVQMVLILEADSVYKVIVLVALRDKNQSFGKHGWSLCPLQYNGCG